MPKSTKVLPVVGWREWVQLPDLCEESIKVKIDTGARTSSLHAFDLQVSTSTAGQRVASFEIHPSQRSSEPRRVVVAPILGFREVRSSSGHRERRPVIATEVVLGAHRLHTEVTLAARDEMGFRMLLGRAAIRRRFLVDPGRSYCHGDRT